MSRNPDNKATITKMSPAVQSRYDRIKGHGVVGWAHDQDPWSWTDAKADDPWPGSHLAHQGAWPPAGIERR
jgi:hypothetical protein